MDLNCKNTQSVNYQLLSTDNSVKNYFYSKMRKALRIINQLACKPKNEVKPINYNIISKILQRPQ